VLASDPRPPLRVRITIGGLERDDASTVGVRAINDEANPGKARTARLI